ncbi:hypothetical protein [Marispirochaeta aestuarii]|uniref:hypothetical protein n=1 Tax=Marispirochaeta aestuarii TaxID=1963862 RepID=UPI0029C6E804|nr:hypothetical protein [Marispirochaeta aestuarii]
MKKLALLLLALAIVIPAFADDAKVLPAGVLRTTISAAYNMFDESYDEDGDKVDAATGKTSIFNLGGALEYGATDQITIALQWAPGYNVYSSIDDAPGPVPNEDGDLNGPLDLFIGAKAQFLGPNGFVPNDQMRFAAAAGVLVPLKSTDWEESAENYLVANDDYNMGSGSKEVIGIGFRLYYDYLVNKNFFVNLYNETIFYPEQETNTFRNALAQYPTVEDVDIAYGYRATFELEPVYTHPVNEKLDITGSLPFNYVMTPDYEIDGTEQDDSATSFLKMTPYVAAFFKTTMPFELKAGYSIPLMGKNNSVASTVVFQFKSYLKF